MSDSLLEAKGFIEGYMIADQRLGVFDARLEPSCRRLYNQMTIVRQTPLGAFA